MGNAQEAIEEYEQRISNARRINVAKIVTPDENKRVTMILDFKYENQCCYYLTQQKDGKQKWVKDPDVNIWGELIKEYWNSNRSDLEDNEP